VFFCKRQAPFFEIKQRCAPFLHRFSVIFPRFSRILPGFSTNPASYTTGHTRVCKTHSDFWGEQLVQNFATYIRINTVFT